MEQCLHADEGLIEYHKQRREAFWKRPDACETALDALGILYKKVGKVYGEGVIQASVLGIFGGVSTQRDEGSDLAPMTFDL